MCSRLGVISGPLMLAAGFSSWFQSTVGPRVNRPGQPLGSSWLSYSNNEAIHVFGTFKRLSLQWSSCWFPKSLSPCFLSFENKLRRPGQHLQKYSHQPRPSMEVAVHCLKTSWCVSAVVCQPLLHITFQRDVIIPTIPHMEPVTEWHSPQHNKIARLAAPYD